MCLAILLYDSQTHTIMRNTLIYVCTAADRRTDRKSQIASLLTDGLDRSCTFNNSTKHAYLIM